VFVGKKVSGGKKRDGPQCGGKGRKGVGILEKRTIKNQRGGGSVKPHEGRGRAPGGAFRGKGATRKGKVDPPGWHKATEKEGGFVGLRTPHRRVIFLKKGKS